MVLITTKDNCQRLVLVVLVAGAPNGRTVTRLEAMTRDLPGPEGTASIELCWMGFNGDTQSFLTGC